MRWHWSGRIACDFSETLCSSNPACSTSSGRAGRAGSPTPWRSASRPASTSERRVEDGFLEAHLYKEAVMSDQVHETQAEPIGRVLQPTGAPTTVDSTPSTSIYVVALCSVAAIGGFLFGFDSGVVN